MLVQRSHTETSLTTETTRFSAGTSSKWAFGGTLVAHPNSRTVFSGLSFEPVVLHYGHGMQCTCATTAWPLRTVVQEIAHGRHECSDCRLLLFVNM